MDEGLYAAARGIRWFLPDLFLLAADMVGTADRLGGGQRDGCLVGGPRQWPPGALDEYRYPPRAAVRCQPQIVGVVTASTSSYYGPWRGTSADPHPPMWGGIRDLTATHPRQCLGKPRAHYQPRETCGGPQFGSRTKS